MKYPVSCNDIRVRSVHMGVSCQLPISIVKYDFLSEVVFGDLRDWVFFEPLLKLINLNFDIPLSKDVARVPHVRHTYGVR